MTDFDKAYAKLNPAQKEAVDSIEGPVMVMAGPGTGKTQVLAVRIGKILRETQVRPSNILCLTFTETGAFEMRERLVRLLGQDGYYVRVHTFHSFCNEIIVENSDKFINVSGLEPLDDVTRIKIFRSLIDSLSSTSPLKPFGDIYFYLNDLVSAIGTLKREGVSPSDYVKIVLMTEKFISDSKEIFLDYFNLDARKRTVEDSLKLQQKLIGLKDESFLRQYALKIIDTSDFQNAKSQTNLKDKLKKFYEDSSERLPKQKELIIIYQNYVEKLRGLLQFDFEDMLLNVSEKFNEDELFLSKYQEQFQYILVDEFQDTNNVQNKLVYQLGSFFEQPNIFVVGDDDQSIFRFQGASLENILGFWSKFKSIVKTISLTENYRSTQLILDASSSVINNNSSRIGNYISAESSRSLHSNKKESHRIQEFVFEQEREEDFFIVIKIRELISLGEDPKNISVIVRNNSDAFGLVELFTNLSVPFKLYSGKDVLKDPLIKQFMRLLEFLNDFSNSELLFYVLHSDFFDFDSSDVAKILIGGKGDLFSRISDEKYLIDMKVKSPKNFLEFVSSLARWQKYGATKSFEEFFILLFRESGYLNYVLSQKNKLVLLNRFNSIFEEVKKLNRANHDFNLTLFLEHLEILVENNIPLEEHPLETDKNAVSILTAHKSKGLEFETVFISNLVDKKWGNVADRSKIKLPLGLIANQVVLENLNEDERRLFYVALTRAKSKIYLTHAVKGNGERERVPCMFLGEISNDHKDIIANNVSDEFQRLESILIRPERKNEVDNELILGQLKDYKLSVTHLNNYLECPRLWYYQNLLRVPSAKDKNAIFGTSVHLSFRDLFADFSRTEKLKSKSEFISLFEKHLSKEALTSKEFEDSLHLGRTHLGSYYERYSLEFHKNIIVEYDFSNHGVVVSGVPIVGKLDKVEIVDDTNRIVRVHDYKTGNPDSRKKDMSVGGKYYRQIVFYQLLCENSPRFDFKMQSGILDFVQPSKSSGEFVRKEIVVSDSDRKDLTDEIVRVYEEIKSLKFLDLIDQGGCGECEYCKYFVSLQKR